MEPPLKSRFPWIIPGPLQAPRFGRATFPPLPLASLIEHFRVRPNGDMPWAARQRQIAFAPSGGRV